QPIEGPLAGALAGLLGNVLAGRFAGLTWKVADQLLDVDRVIPELQLAGRRVPPHPRAVFADTGAHGVQGDLVGTPVLSGDHHEAGCQALDIPLERSGQRLIEVAQSESQVAL